MNIIVNRPQLVRAVLLYLNKNFGNLTQKTIPKYPDSVFYVNSDNESLMEYDKKNEYVWIHYYQIWSKIESLFPIENRETELIMKHWLEETYKLKGVTPPSIKTKTGNGWRRLTN